VDFTKLPGGKLAVPTGGTPVDLDFGEKTLRVSGTFNLSVLDGLVTVNGTASFESRTADVQLRNFETGELDPNPVRASVMTFGAYQVTAGIDSDPSPSVTDVIGISGVTLGLAIIKPLNPAPGDARKWFAIRTTGGMVTLGPAGVNEIAARVNLGLGSLGGAANNTVVDFRQSFETPETPDMGVLLVDTGAEVSGERVTVSLGFDNKILSFSAEVSIEVGGFFFARGTFSFTSLPNRTITLSDGTTVVTTVRAMGVADAEAFVGVNGPAVDETGTPNPNAIGLGVQGVNFVLVEFTSTTDTRKWSALKGTAATAGLVGVDAFDLALSNAGVTINGGSQGNVPLTTAVDFRKTYESAPGANDGVLRIDTGASDDNDQPIVLTLDYSSPTTEATGTVTIGVAGFVQVQGTLAFRKGGNMDVTLSDGTQRTVSVLTVGGSNVSVFAGVNGPASNPDAAGLSLSGGEFALAILKAPDGTTFRAIKATAANVSVIGIDDLRITGSGLSVGVNGTSQPGPNAPVVDFGALPGGRLTVPTGASSLDLDFTQRLLRVSGRVTLGTPVADLIGNFFFERSTNDNGTPGDPADDFDETLFAAADVETFLGSNGGTPDDASDDVGVKLTGDVIMLLTPEKTYAFEVDGGAQLVGVPGLTLSGTVRVSKNTTGLAINRTISAAGITRQMELPVGASSFGGTLTIEIANFVAVSGAFGFDKVVTGAGPTAVTKIRVAVTDFSAFLGVGRGTPDAIGIEASGGTLGLVVIQQAGQPTKYALDATATLALVGLPGLTIQGEVGVRVNRTGGTVDERVPTPAGDSLIQFETADDVLEISGRDITISVGGVFTVRGDVVATMSPGGSVLIDVRRMSLALVINGVAIAGLEGSIRFSIGGADGFRLRDMQITNFSILGVQLPGNPLGVEPAALVPPPALPALSDGPPTADLANPDAGGSVDLTSFNKRGSIDVKFTVPDGAALDPATILDAGPEFTLSGPGLGDAQLVSGMPEDLGNNTFRYKFVDSDTGNTTGLFQPGQVTVQFIAGAFATQSGQTNAAESETFTVNDGRSSTTRAVELGPISLRGPTIGLDEFQFKIQKDPGGGIAGARLILTVAVGVDEASLTFGRSPQATQSSFDLTLTGLQGTFDVNIDLNVPDCLGELFSNPLACVSGVSLGGRWGIAVETLSLTIPNLVEVTGAGIQVQFNPDADADGDGTVSSDEQEAFDAQEIVRVERLQIRVPRFDISGELEPYTKQDGTTLPGLLIRKTRFTLGRASLTVNKTIDVGSILRLQDITFGLSGLDVALGENVHFSAEEIFFGSRSVELFPGRTFGGSAVDGPDADQFGIFAALEFEDGQIGGFRLEVDQLEVRFGSFLTVMASQFELNTDAGPTEEVVAFQSLGARLQVASLDIAGQMRNFAILGDGTFVAKQGFGVFFSLEGTDSSKFGWPSFLPIQITELGIKWPDITANPANFSIVLSANVTAIKGLEGKLQFSGAVKGIEIDLGLLAQGKFPITRIDSFGVSISGQIFGGTVSAGLIGGILRVHCTAGNVCTEIPTFDDTTPVTDRVFFVGVQGGFSMAGLGGLTIRFALSELGPLGVFFSLETPPPGIPLDPFGVVQLTGFAGSVEFFKTLPVATEPDDLLKPEFAPTGEQTALDANTWLTEVKQQVVAQVAALKQNPNLSGFLAAFTSPMLIKGSATLSFAGTGPDVLRAVVDLKISTDGKIAMAGELIVADGALRIPARLYADLSQLASGDGRFLFITKLPVPCLPSAVFFPLSIPTELILKGKIAFQTEPGRFELVVQGAIECKLFVPDAAQTAADLAASIPGVGAVVGDVLTFLKQPIYAIRGEVRFAVEKTDDATRAVLDFNGTAEVMLLGNIASVAGRFVLANQQGELQFWGIVHLKTNFEKLRPVGINLDVFATLQINISNETKTETLTLKGVGQGGADLVQTFTLDPLMFRIEAAGALLYHVPTGTQTLGIEVFRLSGAFSIEISPAGLRVFVAAELKFGPEALRLFEFTASGVIIATAQGVAMKMELSLNALHSSVLRLDAKFLLTLNFTSQDQEMRVSDTFLNGPYLSQEFKDRLEFGADPSQGRKFIHVPRGPPQIDGTIGDPGPYIVIEAAGEVVIAEVIKIQGFARFEISASVTNADAKLSVLVSGRILLGPLGHVTAFGFLEIKTNALDPSKTAIVGAFRFDAEFPILEPLGIDFDVEARIIINTTSEARTIQVPFGTSDIETFDIPAGFLLQIRLAGKLIISFPGTDHELFRLTGVFFMEINPEGFALFVDASLPLNIGPVPVAQFDASGLVVINEDGFAADLTLTFQPPPAGSILQNVLDFQVSARLVMNVTGKRQEFKVTDDLLEFLSPSSSARLEDCADGAPKKCLVIPGGAPNLDGSEGAPGPYFVIEAEGDLVVFTVFRLHGDFRIEIAVDRFQLGVNASLSLDPLGTVVASGFLEINSEGVVGSMLLAGKLSLGPITFVGAFTFELNSTGSDKTIQRYQFDFESETVLAQKVDVTIPANTVRIFIAGKLRVAGFTIRGTFELINSPDVFSIRVDGTLDVFIVTLNVSGTFKIVKRNNPGIVLNLTTSASLNIAGVINISGRFVIQFNSRSVNDEGIPARSFKIAVEDLNLSLLGVLNFTGSGFIEIRQGVFRMGFQVSGSFLGIFNVDASGFVSSEGEFEFRLSGRFELSVGFSLGPISGSIGIRAGFSAMISRLDNNGTEPFGDGNFVFRIEAEAFGELFAEGCIVVCASISIGISAGVSYNSGTGELKVRGCLKILGKRVCQTFGLGTFGNRPPEPVYLAGDRAQQFGGGTLNLNVGSRADQSGLGGGVDETVLVNFVEQTGNGNTVEVRIGDHGQRFRNVTQIAADAGDGNDRIIIGPDVTVPVQLSGGSGDDELSNFGTGPSTLDGGPGDDLLTASPNAAQPGTAGGSLSGGDGNDRIFGSAYNEVIDGGPGDDDITPGGGADQISAGSGDDTVHYRLGDGSDTQMDFGSGADTLDYDLGAGDETLRITSPAAGQARFATVDADNNVIEAFTAQSLETLDLNLGDGADRLNVSSLRGSGVADITLDLGGVGTASDGDADQVTLSGDAGDDTFTLTPVSATSIQVAHDGVYTMTLQNGVRSEGDSLEIETLAGNDTIDAGALDANVIALTFSGDTGDDTVIGSPFNDVIDVGTGGDNVQALSGQDTIIAVVSDGDDLIDGGPGFDTLFADGTTAADTWELSRTLLATGRRAMQIANLDGSGATHSTLTATFVESLNLRTGEGADQTTLGDIRFTGVRVVTITVSPNGDGDDATDDVTVVATPDNDNVLVDAVPLDNGIGRHLDVSGLAYTVAVFGTEPANDTFTLVPSGGEDFVTIGNGVTADSNRVENIVKTFTIDDRGGYGTVIIGDDADFSFTDDELLRSTGGTIHLMQVDAVRLTGGPSENSFVAAEWTGTAYLDGAGGGDSYDITLSGVGAYSIADSGPLGSDIAVVNTNIPNEPFQVTATLLSRHQESVAFDGNLEKLTLNDLALHTSFADQNSVSVQPSANTQFVLNGSGSGMLVTFDLLGLTNPVLELTGPDAGVFSADGRQNVAYNGFSQVDTIGGTLRVLHSTTPDPAPGEQADDGVADTFRVVRSGSLTVDLFVNGVRVNRFSASVFDTVVLTGSNDRDTFVLDISQGLFPVTVQVQGVAPAAGDALELIGRGTEQVAYEPTNKKAGSGIISGMDEGRTNTIRFSDLAIVAVHDLAELSVITQGSNDVLTIDTDPAVGVANNRVSGTSTGIRIVPVTFYNVPVVHLDAGARDAVEDPRDAVTLEAAGLVAAGLRSFDIRTGSGDDRFTLLNSLYTTPLASSFQYFGGAGVDTIAATRDLSWVLTNARLTSSAGGSVELDSIENGVLTGGLSNNTFDVTGWTGTATLDGAAGTADRLVSVNDSGFDLADGSLVRATGGTFAFSNLEIVNLTGGPSSNTFTVQNWTGIATIDGGDAGDTYAITFKGSGPGRTTIADTGPTGSDAASVFGTPASDTIELTATTITREMEVVTYGGLETLRLDAALANDALHIRSTAATTATTVTGGAFDSNVVGATYDDTFVVGSNAPASDGVLDLVAGPLTIDGDVGADTVTFDDTGDAAANTGRLEPTRLSGLGTAVGITYTNFESLTLALGSGGTELVIDDTIGGTSLVTALGGPDTIHLLRSTGALTVQSGAGADAVNLQTAGSTVRVETGAGADVIRIGSRAPADGGTLNGFAAPITLAGGLESDSLVLDDSGDTTDNSGGITSSTVDGLGLPAAVGAAINYSEFELLRVQLGSGRDEFTVSSTHAARTEIDTGGGADTVNITKVAGPLGLNTGDGADAVNVKAISAATTIATGAGSDTVVVTSTAPVAGGSVNRIRAALQIAGGDGDSDSLTIDDSADTARNTGSLNAVKLAGLGTAAGIDYSGIDLLTVNLGLGGDEFTITNTHAGTTVLNTGGGADTIHLLATAGITMVNAGSSADTINVQSVGAATTIHGDAGSDTVNVGSLAPATGGTVNGIAAMLAIHGDDDADALNVDDTGDAADNSGALATDRISGLGTATGIDYFTFETLGLSLGSGADQFEVTNTHTGSSTLHTGAGADSVLIRATAAGLLLNTADGADTVAVRAIGAAATVNLGAGDDAIQVGSLAPDTASVLSTIAAALTINGDGGLDRLTIDNRSDATDRTGSLSATKFTGFGLGGALTYGSLEALTIRLGGGPNTLAVTGTHAGTTAIATGDGADSISVQRIAGMTTISTAGGDDTLVVGSLAPAAGGNVNGIAGSLSLDAGGGGDSLTIDDSGDSAVSTSTLTSSLISGMGSGAPIGYAGVESLLVWFGSGNDLLTVPSTIGGRTEVRLGAGHDRLTLVATSGQSEWFGETGNDTMTGTPGNDRLFGGPGNDRLADGGGDDLLDGSSGNDTYVLTPGSTSAASADVVTDAAGSDQLDFSGAATGIRVDLDSPAVQSVNDRADTLQLVGQFENFRGSNFNDSIFAKPLNVPRDIDGGPSATIPLGDALRFDTLGLSAQFTHTSVTVDGFATVRHRNIEAFSVSSFLEQFDFNLEKRGEPTPTAAGYVGVLATDRYSADRGFGWLSATPDLAGFDHGGANALLRDGNYATRATFAVDLPLANTYFVSVIMGDLLPGSTGNPHDMSVRIGGVEVARVVNPGGQSAQAVFQVAATQLSATGQLALEFVGRGSEWFVINALNVRSIADLDTITLTQAVPLPNDGVSRTVITGTSKLPEKTLVTVSSTLGKIITPDASSQIAGQQVEVGVDGRFQFMLQAGSAAGAASITAVDFQGAAFGTLSVPINFAVTRRFDFNTKQTTSPTAAGHIAVLPARYSSSLGFGWYSIKGLSSVDRRGPNSLDRDFHFGTSGKFLIDTPSESTPYTVTLRMGDATTAHDNIDVLAEGVRVLHIDSLAAGTFYDFTFSVVVSDGQLTIEFLDMGGNDRNFVINGLTLVDPPSSHATVVGDDSPNRFFVTQQSGTTLVFVDDVLKAQVIGTDPTRAIQLFGMDGDDTFEIGPSVRLPVLIDPGAGEDLVTGGGRIRLDLVGPAETLRLNGPFAGLVQAHTALASVEVFGNFSGSLLVDGLLSSVIVHGNLTGQITATGLGLVQIDGSNTGTVRQQAVVKLQDLVKGDPDTAGPQVIGARTIANTRNVTAFVVNFDEALQSTTVRTLSNYRVISPGTDRLFGTNDDQSIALRSATYLSSERAVRLTPVKRLGLNQFYKVVVNGSSTLADVAGNRFGGEAAGTPAADHTTVLGRGTALTYADSDNDVVTLTITRGGTIELQLDGVGSDPRVQLFDTVAGSSELTGRVTRSSTGDGRARIRTLSGITGVQNNIQTNPSFVVGEIAAAVSTNALATGPQP
jgi:hypothetical protein